MKNKLPIYTPTKSLDVNYHFTSGDKENASIVVEGGETHALLNTACKEFIDLRNSKYKPSDTVNFATASLTFLYTNTSTEEGYLGDDIQKAIFSLNIPDHKNRIFSTGDFYTQKYSQETVKGNKSSRCTSFNYHLNKRVDAFSLISDSYHMPVKSVPVTSTNGLTKAIAGAMFHETFHHTEQTVMHYLSSDSGIKSLVNTALSLKASYFYGVVLDLHSQRMVCGNCNVGLLGMQNSYANQGFVVDLVIPPSIN